MAGKTKQAIRRRKRGPGQPSPKAIGIVVRRGALRRFDALKRKTEKLPVTVTWDRRQGERRSSSREVEGDRRKTDRRQKPPFTWALADFVVVMKSGRRAARAKAKTKAR